MARVSRAASSTHSMTSLRGLLVYCIWIEGNPTPVKRPPEVIFVTTVVHSCELPNSGSLREDCAKTSQLRQLR